jgi:hypothetical protein
MYKYNFNYIFVIGIPFLLYLLFSAVAEQIILLYFLSTQQHKRIKYDCMIDMNNRVSTK